MTEEVAQAQRIMNLDVGLGEIGGLPNDLREVLIHPSFIDRISAVARIYRETKEDVDQSFAVWGKRRKRLLWQTAFTNIDFGEIVDNKTSPDFEKGITSSEFFKRGRPVLAITTITSKPDDPKQTERDLKLQGVIIDQATLSKNTALMTITVGEGEKEAEVEIAKVKQGFDVHKSSNGKYFVIVNDEDTIVKTLTLSFDELLGRWEEFYDLYRSTVPLE